MTQNRLREAPLPLIGSGSSTLWNASRMNNSWLLDDDKLIGFVGFWKDWRCRVIAKIQRRRAIGGDMPGGEGQARLFCRFADSDQHIFGTNARHVEYLRGTGIGVDGRRTEFRFISSVSR
jgi:hypothetical protein